jgi:predicted TIM-barrel fold metal-dependent hydrolase
MMTFDKIATATIDDLNREFGEDYPSDAIAQAREVLAARFSCFVGVDLIDSETNEVIRRATEDEAVQSVQTIEGHILVDGRKCYVAE